VATDTRTIILKLTKFYDFTGKTVIDVGAGGGNLVEYARSARRVFAIDRDAGALARLEARLQECELTDRFSVIDSDFLGVRPPGDVVLFEFSLHEMESPARALAHARRLAPDVLVIDHAPRSPWAWYMAEDREVDAAWEVVARHAIRRRQAVKASQRFRNYDEIESLFAQQGGRALARIASYRGQRKISIPMPYQLALL